METFADYILAEKSCTEKMIIMCYLHNKKDIFFDNSVVLKTFIAKSFLDTMNIDVDRNLVITACLLYACKKDIMSHDIEKIRKYASDGANYLETLGFSKRFCKICSEVNRYVNTENREKESDILELVDNFGGLVLDRPERKGFPIDIAMNVLENRNLKDLKNVYLNEFKTYISLKDDTKIYNNTEIVYKPNSDFNPNVEDLIRLAKTANTPEDFIAYVSGAKEEEDIEERVMKKITKIKDVIKGRTNISNV